MTDPMTAVFSAITADLSTSAYLVGLAAVCGIVALIKFSNRSSNALLGKIGRG